MFILAPEDCKWNENKYKEEEFHWSKWEDSENMKELLKDFGNNLYQIFHTVS